jgi:hypothetical protein
MPRLPKPTGRTAKSKDLGKAVRAHIKYKAHDEEGREINVPGVTTITGQMNKPFLVGWANRLGLEGIDSQAYTAESQKIGTAAHGLIEADLRGDEFDLSDFTPNQIDKARYGFEEFKKFRALHTIEPLLLEQAFTSDKYRYGGQLDFYGLVDGVPTLMDFKTSASLYPEHGWQVSAYYALLREAGHEVKGARLLRIGRSAEEGFDDHVFNGVQIVNAFKIFVALLNVYWVRKSVKDGAE